MQDIKRILIVDDSEIDREVLHSILDGEFDVTEASNGYAAINKLVKKKEKFDAILLDVSMPRCDGFNVLRKMRENDLQDVQIFMITVEATKENIEKASQYKIADFIKKPFNREEILKRLKGKLGVQGEARISGADIEETRKYISDLEYIYERYLNRIGKSKVADARREYLMRLLLDKAAQKRMGVEKLDDFQIEMICKAAYLCNIGNMLLQSVPSNMEIKGEISASDNFQQHTVMGSYLVRLNYSKHCKRFIDICAGICLHHHERYDGKGFPHGISGDNNSIYAQICGLLERFDALFLGYSKQNATQFDYVIDQLGRDSGFVSKRVFSLLVDCKDEVVKYYKGDKL